MKTAMQEFFLVMKEFNKDLYNTMYNEGILDIALEKEKEQLIDFAERYHDFGFPNQTAEEYYNETYNSDTRA